MRGQNEYRVEKGRYQLRHAAGVYWLLDMKQSSLRFEKPLAINEIGAEIWKLMEAGNAKEEIVQILSAEYKVNPQEVMADIDNFEKELMQFGIGNEV